MIFGGPLPVPNIVTAIKALDILQSDAGKQVLQRLWDNTAQANNGLLRIGYETNGGTTPIIIVPVVSLGELIACCLYCYEHGIYFNPATYPTVPKKHNALRIVINATHMPEQIDKLTKTLGEFKKGFSPA